jgi:fumarylacetoacetate (FAA) hydrolase
MKLATYKDGSRDGQLVVVSRDLTGAHYATGIANKLQQALDDWNFLSPQLQDLYDTLNRAGISNAGNSKWRHAFPFDPQQCMAPLPRAYQRVDGSAYLNHVALMCNSVARELSKHSVGEPLLCQRASDDLLGAYDDVVVASDSLGIDFVAQLAVITGDVRLNATPAQALDGIRLLMLANDIELRHLASAEMTAADGSLLSHKATSFSPVAVTLDELGETWDKGRLHLILQSSWNGRRVGMCDAGMQMTFHFGQLIAQLCKNRKVRAGTIICSGAVSNNDRDQGYSCIAEKRALETRDDGHPATEFMKYGDIIRIEMKGLDGLRLFGAIEQKIVPIENARAE